MRSMPLRTMNSGPPQTWAAISAGFAFLYDMDVERYLPSYNGWGVTAFDALDTMLLMDLKDEYRRAVHIVEMTDFNRTTV